MENRTTPRTTNAVHPAGRLFSSLNAPTAKAHLGSCTGLLSGFFSELGRGCIPPRGRRGARTDRGGPESPVRRLISSSLPGPTEDEGRLARLTAHSAGIEAAAASATAMATPAPPTAPTGVGPGRGAGGGGAAAAPPSADESNGYSFLTTDVITETCNGFEEGSIKGQSNRELRSDFKNLLESVVTLFNSWS